MECIVKTEGFLLNAGNMWSWRGRLFSRELQSEPATYVASAWSRGTRILGSTWCADVVDVYICISANGMFSPWSGSYTVNHPVIYRTLSFYFCYRTFLVFPLIRSCRLAKAARTPGHRINDCQYNERRSQRASTTKVTLHSKILMRLNKKFYECWDMIEMNISVYITWHFYYVGEAMSWW